MKMPLQRPGQKLSAAHGSPRRGITWLLLVSILVAGVFVLREMRRDEAGHDDVGAQAPSGLRSWGAQRGVHRLPGTGDNTSAPAMADDGGADPKAPTVDNSSQIDGAPPVPIEATAASSSPIPAWGSLAPEHMPEAPVRTRSPTGVQDVAALTHRVETLLVADPEALQQARALLNEPDPEIRARNLQILADSFGLE